MILTLVYYLIVCAIELYNWI